MLLANLGTRTSGPHTGGTPAHPVRRAKDWLRPYEAGCLLSASNWRSTYCRMPPWM